MATAESDASMWSSDFCEDSDSSNENESSDELIFVTENMEMIELRDNQGM